MRWLCSGRVLSALLMSVGISCACANSSGAESIVFGTGVPITSFDPHFYNATGNNAAVQHVFEPLVSLDANLKLVPRLAISWRIVGDTVWEFALRTDVTWHDGTPFTAEDVAFTIGRARNVPNSPGSFAGYVRAITRVEVVNSSAIRFHTDRPHPLLPNDLSLIGIVSQRVGNGATTDDYNRGSAAIGTGPFRLLRFRQGQELVLQRSESWWGPRQSFDEIQYRFIPNPAARTAAILAGDVDVIDQLPAPDQARIRATPRLRVAEAQGVQMIFLIMNMATDGSPPLLTDNAGSSLQRNPLRDLRVRQALSLAVNRDALVHSVMDGRATPTGQWVPPGITGYDPTIGVPSPDPAAARRLLEEAGYPEGFRITLSTSNDRYPNDARVAAAVAQMWTRVGVNTSVEAIPFSTLAGRVARQNFAVRLLGWGAVTGNPSPQMLQLFSTFNPEAGMGSVNHGRYSNAAFDRLVVQTLSTMDDTAREELFREAGRFMARDVAFIPLFFINNYWAVRRELPFTPRSDTYSVFTTMNDNASR